ncbi:MAG: 50S ribosomal protein L24 [Planctomycetales bacterium 4484_113]|nr:MAG: 50S ribosomal protein L24 [Planctomycetales bacterium 4484_113]
MSVSRIRKGDTVMVLAGKDRGRTGKVIKVLTKKGKVVVENINIARKHQRPTQETPQGSIIDKPMPLDMSNVMVVDKTKNEPTRVGRKQVHGKWMRYAKRSGEIMDSRS